MELLCTEREFEPTASLDSAILDDDRLLHNLILLEERYLITGSYFKCLQTELKPSMREVVANWMLEVCEEERCQREVYPLAMNLLDRFLAVVRINKTQLQLLGSVCLFIASKMRQSRPLSPKALVQYTDWSITLEELTGWEMLVLSRLKWDVAAVPPNDFVGPLLRRLAKKFKLIDEHNARIKKHTLNMIDLCSADFNFSMLPSSMVAAASIITTIDGILYGIANRDANTLLLFKSLSSQILYQLHEITGIEKELLCECQQQIEQKIGGPPPPPPPPHAPVHVHHPHHGHHHSHPHAHHPHHHHHHQPQPVSCGVASVTADSVSLKSSSLVGSGGCPGSAVLVDCPKENYNSANSLINTADNCGLHPRLFKHTPCVVSDASIGVEF